MCAGVIIGACKYESTQPNFPHILDCYRRIEPAAAVVGYSSVGYVCFGMDGIALGDCASNWGIPPATRNRGF